MWWENNCWKVPKSIWAVGFAPFRLCPKARVFFSGISSLSLKFVQAEIFLAKFFFFKDHRFYFSSQVKSLWWSSLFHHKNEKKMRYLRAVQSIVDCPSNSQILMCKSNKHKCKSSIKFRLTVWQCVRPLLQSWHSWQFPILTSLNRLQQNRLIIQTTL